MCPANYAERDDLKLYHFAVPAHMSTRSHTQHRVYLHTVPAASPVSHRLNVAFQNLTADADAALHERNAQSCGSGTALAAAILTDCRSGWVWFRDSNLARRSSRSACRAGGNSAYAGKMLCGEWSRRVFRAVEGHAWTASSAAERRWCRQCRARGVLVTAHECAMACAKGPFRGVFARALSGPLS